MQTKTGGTVYSEFAHLFSLLWDGSGYWSGLDNASAGGYAWLFNFASGYQDSDSKFGGYYAMAVHSGDVGGSGKIPEPETFALMLAALACTGVIRRRRALGASAS